MDGRLHPQVRALLEAAGGDGPAPAGLEAERAAYLDTALRLGGKPERVAATEDVVVPSGDVRLPARLHVPLHEPRTTGLLVWLHGGGWCLGDLAGFDRVGRALANATGLRTLIVAYRLAPEHPWPAPAEDAAAALAWARSAGGAAALATDPARVVVGGDSAGGQLATLAARRCAADGRAPLAGQLLVYPALDPARDSDAYREFADGPVLTAEEMRICWERYLAGHPPDDPDVALLDAGDLAAMPPTWLAVAGLDPLRDDGLRYARRLRAAGVPVRERRFDDMPHGFLRWGGIADRTRELMDWLGDAAREAVAGVRAVPPAGG